MGIELNKSAIRCIGRILKPVARLCLRQGISVQQVIECTKVAFVDAATETLSGSKNKPNVSRLSLLTGLRRREVGRIIALAADEGADVRGAILTRVVGWWLTKEEFRDKNGRPKILSTNGDKSDFYQLVKKVSRDISPGTVLGEFLRSGTVEMVDGGVALKAEMFVSAPNSSEGLEFLGMDVRDLLMSVQENIFDDPKIKNHHLTTEFSAISADRAQEVKEWLLERGAELHKSLRNYLAEMDQESVAGKTKAITRTLCRVVFGSFSFVEENKHKKAE